MSSIRNYRFNYHSNTLPRIEKMPEITMYINSYQWRKLWRKFVDRRDTKRDPKSHSDGRTNPRKLAPFHLKKAESNAPDKTQPN